MKKSNRDLTGNLNLVLFLIVLAAFIVGIEYSIFALADELRSFQTLK